VNCTALKTCKQDSDCGEVSQKCCAAGCEVTKCTKAVLQKCVATGYRSMQCLDTDTYTKLYGTTGVPTEPPIGVPVLAETCYQCVQGAICASNGTNCGWSDAMKKCLATCSTPPTTPPPPAPCSALGVCKCMTDPQCGWCHFSDSYTSLDKTTTSTIPLGRCLLASLFNKCTAETTAAGYAGTYISTKPTECTLASSSDNTKDPATGITDEKIKAMMTQVIDGNVTALDLQKRLTDAGVTGILIVAVVPPFSDGGKMIFRVTITITSTTKTIDEARKNLNDAVVLYFGVDVKTQLATTDLLAQSTPAKKRSTGGSDYLQTTTIQSAPPNVPGPQPGQQPPNDKIQSGAGSTISPFWLCSILIALLFLR
jgi:hypothetical protein